MSSCHSSYKIPKHPVFTKLILSGSSRTMKCRRTEIHPECEGPAMKCWSVASNLKLLGNLPAGNFVVCLRLPLSPVGLVFLMNLRCVHYFRFANSDTVNTILGKRRCCNVMGQENQTETVSGSMLTRRYRIQEILCQKSSVQILLGQLGPS